MAKTMPEWDGRTYNDYPYISRNSDAILHCCVDTWLDGEYENNCGWQGPVHETKRGRSPIGSKPISLLCPDCGRMLAAQKGTSGAGYWSKLDE